MKTTFSLILACLLLLSFTAKKKPSFKSAYKILNGFCQYVPSGNAVVNGDTSSVQGFFMSPEITNLQYAEFLFYLKKKGRTEKLETAKLHVEEWNSIGSGHNAPYVEHYHKHPAYQNYPVVNVTRQGAELYCEWLTEIYDSLSNGELKIKFRIPTHVEWMRAARGDQHMYRYSWGGPYLRNSKGQILANFTRLGAENISRNSETGNYEVKHVPVHFMVNDYADVTAPSTSYWPNDFGLYNMNGNVSEMIADGPYAVGGDWRSPGYDIRNESIKSFDKPNPTVGFRIVATYIHPTK